MSSQMPALPPPDLDAIITRLAVLAKALDDAHNDHRETPSSLRSFRDAVDRLAEEISATVNADAPLSALADRGVQLISRLTARAAEANMTETASELELLSFPFVLWTVRQGAQPETLAPMVEGLAKLANAVREPAELARLYAEMTEIVDAVEPGTLQAPGDALSPGGVLLINRAIVATRTHDPRAMAEAYDAIVTTLPQWAAGFFEEAMSQMDAIGYPGHVREVVMRYHQRFSGSGTLH